MASKKTYSMPRGDSRSLPLSLPIDTYIEGSSIFFALKSEPDNDADDSTAVLIKEITDDDIDETTETTVNYIFELEPEDTNDIEPGTYRAEFQFVSADQSKVITYPNPAKSKLYWEITADINRRTI